MKNIHLVRQDHNNPDFQIIDQSICFLNTMLDEAPRITKEDFSEIINFQDTDGSFKLLDSYEVESDARVDLCHVPTYLATAVLMKAYLHDSKCLSGKEESILVPALTMCCARALRGHGFDDLSGQIAAMRIFLRAGVPEFVSRYPEMCPKFTMMINSIVDMYRAQIAEEKFVFYFGENHEQDFREIVRHFPEECYIFVYGTLMKGQRNYAHYLAPAEPCATAVLNGYRMFDIGSFPGIVRGRGDVKGEVYRVNAQQLAAIDRLEGEGDLYIKTPVNVMVTDDSCLRANVYVYNRKVKGLPEIPFDRQPYGKSDKVWYVAYGSNLLEERLEYYIKGGTCPYNGRHYTACTDTAMPEKSIPMMIPYDMYYSNFNMGSWKDSAVCFLDLTKPGKAYGRAWLVTRSQLEEIHRHEGKGANWYPERVQLDDIDGLPAYTFANYINKQHEEFSHVSAPYGIILYKGMKETYPKMSDNDILSYLISCGR